MTDTKRTPRPKPRPPVRPKSIILPSPSKIDNIDDDGKEEDEDYLLPISPSTSGPSKKAGHDNLAGFVGKHALPVCVRVSHPLKSGSSAMTIREGDELMLHCTHQTKYVKAVDSKGRRYQLPVFAKQLYQSLPQGKLKGIV